MNPRINQLVKSLLQKESLDQCSLQELQQFADRHPYFGAAQLLLTKKMQNGDPEQYNEQLQKTFLFFHNPLWVEQLLNDNGKATVVPGKKEEQLAIAEETAAISQPVTKETVTTKTTAEEVVRDELIIEPYHTVDYFASQGIKWKEEEKPADKFGQQLKNFNEWLKTMKRLPVSEIAKKTEPVAEKKVEEMAEHSLEDRDVITETMAEVWEKQGNTAKAIEIFSKLCLLEPSKSAYFAAKIEELKKTN